MIEIVTPRHNSLEGPPWRILPPDQSPEGTSEAQKRVGNQVTVSGKSGDGSGKRGDTLREIR